MNDTSPGHCLKLQLEHLFLYEWVPIQEGD